MSFYREGAEIYPLGAVADSSSGDSSHFTISEGDYLRPWEGDCSGTLWWLPKPNRSLRSPSSQGQVFLLQYLKRRSRYTASAPESILFLRASWAAAAGPEVVGTRSTQDNFCGSVSQPCEVLEAQEAESVEGSPS